MQEVAIKRLEKIKEDKDLAKNYQNNFNQYLI